MTGIKPGLPGASSSQSSMLEKKPAPVQTDPSQAPGTASGRLTSLHYSRLQHEDRAFSLPQLKLNMRYTSNWRAIPCISDLNFHR